MKLYKPKDHREFIEQCWMNGVNASAAEDPQHGELLLPGGSKLGFNGKGYYVFSYSGGDVPEWMFPLLGVTDFRMPKA